MTTNWLMRTAIVALAVSVLPSLTWAQEDKVPPELVSFSFTPQTIDVSSGPQVVTITAHLTDNLSGVGYTQVCFNSPSRNQAQYATFGLVSGTPLDGIWEAQISVPQHSEAGTWYVGYFFSQDAIGNTILPDLAGRGFPTELQVTYGEPTDTTPPVLTLSSDMTIEATSAQGAVVTYMVAATDLVDGAVPVTCAPASGGRFPLGVNEVVCNSSDLAGNTARGSFTVAVVDTTPPTLQLPSQVTVDASSPSGAVVSFTAGAVDIVDLQPVVTCVPASGAVMPIGWTTVTCTGTDSRGNSATGSFAVLVKAAAAQIQDLVALVESFDLQQGIARSLDAKLQRAYAALEAANAGDRPTACKQLGASINEVNAQAAKELSQAQAVALVTAATRIRAVIGCQ